MTQEQTFAQKYHDSEQKRVEYIYDIFYRYIKENSGELVADLERNIEEQYDNICLEYYEVYRALMSKGWRNCFACCQRPRYELCNLNKDVAVSILEKVIVKLVETNPMQRNDIDYSHYVQFYDDVSSPYNGEVYDFCIVVVVKCERQHVTHKSQRRKNII